MLNGLYYFKQEGKQFTPVECTLFNYEELFRINASIQIMKRFFKNLSRSVAAQNAYKEFIEEVEKPHGSDPYAQAEVDRRFRAFIFEWKLYTEHWKNYIHELSDSVYTDEFVTGYQELFDDLMDEAFMDSRFITAHVIRNYVSHANEAVTHCHIGKSVNEFCLTRNCLLDFLDKNIAKVQGKKRKDQLDEQKAVIEASPELLNLESVARDAMTVLRWLETNLMNYQIEPQTLQAISILTDAKRRIDEAGIESDIWEFMSPTPLTMVDHVGDRSMTLETTINGQRVKQTIFHDRLNWKGYQAVMDYILKIVAATKTAEGEPKA